MASCIDMSEVTVENVNCGTACCDSGSLYPPPTSSSKVGVIKCEIQTYEPVDTGTSYDIVFTMKNGMIVTWSFGNILDRDTSFEKVKLALGAQEM